MITHYPLLLWPYFLLVVVGLIVPSDGEHGILSIKSLSFLAANMCLGCYIFLKHKLNFFQFKLLFFLCSFLSLLLLWVLISLLRDETTAQAQMDQFKLFVITITFPLATIYLVNERLITSQQLFKAVLYASFTYVFVKVVLVTLHLLHLVDLWKIIYYVGVRYMRMDIYGGLERVQTSVDITTPFLVFFLLNSHRLGLSFSRTFKGAYVVFGLFSTFLSFSRYLIFVYFLSCCLYWMTLNWKGTTKVIVFMFLFCCAGISAIGPEVVGKIIERRVFSRDNTLSDQTRVIQVEAMWEEFERKPFFGTGIGGYAPSNIRDQASLHLYEVQWMAFLMQFGVIGLFLLLSPLVLISMKILHAPFSRGRCALFGAFLLWLLSGLTNPFLISLASGIMYTLYYLAAETFDEGGPAHSKRFAFNYFNLRKV